MIASRAVEPSARVRELRDAAWLALVPMGAALAFGVLLAPRWASPDWVPLPIVNAAAVAKTIAVDHDLAESTRRDPLPSPVRALGSALRAFHSLEAHDADARAMGQARRDVDAALAAAVDGGDRPLLALRATELEGFLAEVSQLAATGFPSPELDALGGSFLRAMSGEGWYQGGVLVPSEVELRAMYKQMWNALLGFEHRPGFEPSLDELRALYAFYLSHPRPLKAMRGALAAARRGARNAKACQGVAEAEHMAIEASLVQSVKNLARIDPTYPADYALGVAAYRHGDYADSAAAFRRWLEAHRDGPLAIRAQNYLRAASGAEHVE